jgi:hypothetical protein
VENVPEVHVSRHTQRNHIFFLDVYPYERDRRMVYGQRSNFSDSPDYNYLWAASYLGVEEQESGDKECN